MGSGFRFQNCRQYQQLTSLCRDDQTPITQVVSFQQIQMILITKISILGLFGTLICKF
jgi:hypothetical protein